MGVRAALEWTAGGGCPYMCLPGAKARFFFLTLIGTTEVVPFPIPRAAFLQVVEFLSRKFRGGFQACLRHAVIHFLSYIPASELAGYFRAVPTGPLGRWFRRGLLLGSLLLGRLPPDNLPPDNLPPDNLRRCWRGGLGEGPSWCQASRYFSRRICLALRWG